jgi:hypothetical protein
MNKTLKQKRTTRKKDTRKKVTRKKSSQKKLAGNYNLIKGNFELSSDIQSKHHKGDFVFGHHQWGRLTNWIASETLIKPTFDMDQLIKNMSHEDAFTAMKARNEFKRKVSRAIILGEGDRQYMLGETLSKFPKIKEKIYREMKLSKLVQILMEHRETIRQWKINLEAKELKKKKPNTRAAENTNKAAENTSPVIQNSGVENWENLSNLEN